MPRSNRASWTGVWSVRVVLKSGECEILSFDEGSREMVVHLSEPPMDGRANMELLKLLSRESGTKVRLKRGHTSRTKIVEFLR